MNGASIVLLLYIFHIQATLTKQVDEPSGIPDGLVVLPAGEIVTQGAQWTVLVTIDIPRLNLTLVRKLDLMYERVMTVVRSMRDPFPLIEELTHMLDSLKLDVKKEHRDIERTRATRSLFGFIGTALHYLTGIPDEAEINECKALINDLANSTNHILHQSHRMLSMINFTASHVNQNQKHILAIQKVTNVLAVAVDELSNATVNLSFQIKRLLKGQFLTSAFLGVEFLYNAWLRQLNHYRLQRNSLEMGYLTEFILPKRHLRHILSRASGMGLSSLSEDYYYQFIRIDPLWEDESRLVFRATLPFVDNNKYIRYNILSFPVPGNAPNTTIKLKVKSDVALDTRSGHLFYPQGSRCFGLNPTICNHNAFYRGESIACYKGIISGQEELRQHCHVDIGFKITNTHIESVGLNSYILVSPGEIMYLNCVGEKGRSFNVRPGVFVMHVHSNCQLQGDAWSVSGVVIRNSNVHVTYDPLDIEPFALGNLTNAAIVVKHIGETKWSEFSPPLSIPIKQLHEDIYTPFTWGTSVKHVSWTGFLVSIIIGGILLVVSCSLLFRFRSKFRSIFPKSKPKTDRGASGLSDVPGAGKSDETGPPKFHINWGKVRNSFRNIYPTISPGVGTPLQVMTPASAPTEKSINEPGPAAKSED